MANGSERLHCLKIIHTINNLYNIIDASCDLEGKFEYESPDDYRIQKIGDYAWSGISELLDVLLDLSGLYERFNWGRDKDDILNMIEWVFSRRYRDEEILDMIMDVELMSREYERISGIGDRNGEVKEDEYKDDKWNGLRLIK